MRIAISGAHSPGKSTLVWDWVKRDPHYIREEEPFRALHREGYPIRFRQECTRLDMAPRVREALQGLDFLVFLPISQEWPVDMEDDGIRPVDLPYRDEVDALWEQIYREQRFNVMPQTKASHRIELWGSREQRLHKLE